SLWAWIYRSAWGIFHHYLRPQGHQRIIQDTVVDHETLLRLTADAKENALEHAERAELCEAICKSLSTLKARHRSVLVLRCFERFSYAEIASVMRCSEIRARVLFFSAKHALKRRLHNRGFGRRYFLTSLSLFGMITAAQTKSASATVTVTSSLVKTPTIAAVIGAITAELGLMKTAVITIAIVAGTICVCTSDADVPIESTSGITTAEAGDVLLTPNQIDDPEITDLLSQTIAADFALPDPCDVDPN
ncbi:MAG: sigma-70 family RNA polymerase sigma factor, partial [Phycisphaerales bacterium]